MHFLSSGHCSTSNYLRDFLLSLLFTFLDEDRACNGQYEFMHGTKPGRALENDLPISGCQQQFVSVCCSIDQTLPSISHGLRNSLIIFQMRMFRHTRSWRWCTGLTGLLKQIASTSSTLNRLRVCIGQNWLKFLMLGLKCGRLSQGGWDYGSLTKDIFALFDPMKDLISSNGKRNDLFIPV